MCEVGTNLEDATKLRTQLEDALTKLLTKQSPVEKVLTQADQVVAKQPTKSEIYSAMATNLGAAWRGLNQQLQQRLQLLEQAVAFYSRCREFSSRMDSFEADHSVTELPNDYEQCRTIISKIVDAKKSVLEASMFSMNEEQLLMEQLQEISDTNLYDSRPHHTLPSVNRTRTMIETHLEELQVRRRALEVLFVMRKEQLDKRMKQLFFARELHNLRLWLLTTGEEYLESFDLGDSTTKIDMILFKNQDIERDAFNIRDQAIKLAKRISAELQDDVELRDKTYILLEDLAEFLAEFERRQDLLRMASIFYDKAGHSDNKLDQIEITLKTWEPSSREAIENMVQTIDDAVGETLDYGNNLLQLSDNPSASQSVSKKLFDLEARKQQLLNLINKLKRKSSDANELYAKKFDLLIKWLLNF